MSHSVTLLFLSNAGPADVLIEYAQSKGLWDFFSPQNRTNLLHCVTDGADEVSFWDAAVKGVELFFFFFIWSSQTVHFIIPTMGTLPQYVSVYKNPYHDIHSLIH